MTQVASRRAAVLAVAALTALVVLGGVGGSSACAQDGYGRFSAARSAYLAADYGGAVRRFEALVADATLRRRSPGLLDECRKYLGASYLFVGRSEDAAKAYREVLEGDPTQELDDVIFPEAARDLFDAVRQEVLQEREVGELSREHDEQRREGRFDALQRENGQLRSFATTYVEERKNSRWVAALPFGIGQFQNGDPILGWTLLVAEGLLFMGSAATAAVNWVFMTFDVPNLTQEQEVATEVSLRIVNNVLTGVLATVVIAGIIDAQLRFKPILRTNHRRPLPDDLAEEGQGDPEQQEDRSAPAPNTEGTASSRAAGKTAATFARQRDPEWALSLGFASAALIVRF